MSKFVPRLRFKEFSEEWTEKRLDELLEFKNGINAEKELYGSGYKFINVLDILNNEFITHDKIIGRVNVTETIMKKNIIEYGDILFQRSSETQDEVGTASVYLDKLNTATFGGFVIRGKKIGSYEPIFLNKLLKTNLVRNQITLKSAGSTRYNVGQGILSSVLLPFPKPKEQQKIANCLSSLDSLIEVQNKKVEALKKHKKGLMQQLFPQEGETVPKLRFNGFSGEWEEMKLKNISTTTTGSSNREDSTDNQGEYTFFDRSEDIRTSHRYLFNDEAIIVAGEGSEFAPKYFKGKFDLHQRTYAILNLNVIGRFLYYYIHKHRAYFLQYAVGSTVKSLRLPMFEKMPILLPTLPEQQEIAKCLSSLDSLIETQNKKVKALKKHKKGLMQQLFVNSEKTI